jgi:hypothetical protein
VIDLVETEEMEVIDGRIFSVAFADLGSGFVRIVGGAAGDLCIDAVRRLESW